jgi:hypothetical protein
VSENSYPSAPTMPPAPQPPQRGPGNGFGIAALILGIVTMVGFAIPFLDFATIGTGVVGVILGIVGLIVKFRPRKAAVAGVILSGLGLLLSIILVVVYAAAFSGAVKALDDSATASNPQSSAAPKASTAPKAPAGTTGELQALVAAKSYLASGLGFSQASLASQLTSSAGNAFSAADAQWAIAHSGADWNAQALAAAKGYVKTGAGFSQASLSGQLTSTAGNSFTAAEAAYGVANAHADWNAQAVIAAKAYVASGVGFSRQSLIQQLTSSAGNQFTLAQAAAAADAVGLK